MHINLIKFLIVLSISSLVLVLLKRNYNRGISASIFLLILMPRELYVELGGGLPTLTGFRAVILTLIFYWLFMEGHRKNLEKTPILSLLFLVLITKLISLLIAFDFAKALDGVLVFLIEILVFYVILVKAMADKEIQNSIMISVASAVFVIAVLGFVEKYTQFNPIDFISVSSHPRFDPRNAYVVYSTFSHPIHFGTALAMGWPICLYVQDRLVSDVKKHLCRICILFLYAGLYFSQSRGPWLAFVIAVISLVFFKYPRIKVKMVPILILTTLVLVSRPGVYHSIHGLFSATFEETSVEGDSFHYRLELFKKAYKEINRSPKRLAFGYGDGAAHSMDLQDTVSYGWGRERSFWSWDSELALILLQGGFVGLIVSLTLYSRVLVYLIKGIKSVDRKHEGIMPALIASASVFIFMMTNVAIFSPQLHFIMWTSFAIGASLSLEYYRTDGNTP